MNGVSLSVERGSVPGLVGESGGGKSTMARMILGIETISSGESFLDGNPISSVARQQTARTVRPVFQDPSSSLNPRKTVAAIIGLPLRALGIGTRAGSASGWRSPAR